MNNPEILTGANPGADARLVRDILDAPDDAPLLKGGQGREIVAWNDRTLWRNLGVGLLALAAVLILQMVGARL